MNYYFFTTNILPLRSSLQFNSLDFLDNFMIHFSKGIATDFFSKVYCYLKMFKIDLRNKGLKMKLKSTCNFFLLVILHFFQILGISLMEKKKTTHWLLLERWNDIRWNDTLNRNRCDRTLLYFIWELWSVMNQWFKVWVISVMTHNVKRQGQLSLPEFYSSISKARSRRSFE